LFSSFGVSFGEDNQLFPPDSPQSSVKMLMGAILIGSFPKIDPLVKRVTEQVTKALYTEAALVRGMVYPISPTAHSQSRKFDPGTSENNLVRSLLLSYRGSRL
jgi:hypothetical protein